MKRKSRPPGASLWGFVPVLCLGLLPACQPDFETEPSRVPAGKVFHRDFFQPPQRERKYWPETGWREKTPAQAGLDQAALEELDKYLFETKTGNERDRAGIRTDGVVLIKRGHIVYERYARGYQANTPHLTWSVTKSFANALTGLAVKKKLVELDQPAANYYPPLNKPGGYRLMTLRHLLNMSSGLDWSEGYEASPLKSSVIAMLYTRGRGDMAAFTASFPLRQQPGRFVYYSSGDSNLIMGILKTRMPAPEYARFPWKELFEPLGMKSVVWERDASGTFVGSSYLYCTARDLARFGFLYLNDGRWNGERLLPKDWVAFSRRPAPAYQTTPLYPDMRKHIYAAQWYSNTALPTRKIKRPWPDAPEDTFAALGHWGQSLFVIPSEDIIAVRFGDDRDKTFNKNTYLKMVVAALGDKQKDAPGQKGGGK